MAQMISIGTDAEIFAVNNIGRAIALCGKIGGTKEQPLQIKGLPQGFCVQEDNVSVEFNIPPAGSLIDWNRYIRDALREVSVMLHSMRLYFSKDAAISFGKDQLLHPNALVFGCEPDYNAWTKMENEKPQCDDPTLRTAGGHIHVGTRGNMIQCVNMMDFYLGVPSVILDNSPTSVRRRKLYGKAGAMRPKPYGFEYRVLSNFWIFTEELRKWVYDNTALAIGSEEAKLSATLAAKIQQCINEGDVNLAKDIVAKNHIPMPNDVAKKLAAPSWEKHAAKVMSTGAGFNIDPMDLQAFLTGIGNHDTNGA